MLIIYLKPFVYKKAVMLRSRVCPLVQNHYSKLQFKLLASLPPSTDEEKERELERISKEASIDDPPVSCCQSGCANCVYIVWAEALTKKMHNAGPEVAEKILKMVEDPSMKAYLEMELRIRGLSK